MPTAPLSRPLCYPVVRPMRPCNWPPWGCKTWTAVGSCWPRHVHASHVDEMSGRSVGRPASCQLPARGRPTRLVSHRRHWTLESTIYLIRYSKESSSSHAWIDHPSSIIDHPSSFIPLPGWMIWPCRRSTFTLYIFFPDLSFPVLSLHLTGPPSDIHFLSSRCTYLAPEDSSFIRASRLLRLVGSNTAHHNGIPHACPTGPGRSASLGPRRPNLQPLGGADGPICSFRSVPLLSHGPDETKQDEQK